MKAQFLLYLIVFFTLLLLSGCGEEQANASEDSPFPEGVENGTVSKDFYAEMISFLEKHDDLESERGEFIIEANPSYDSNSDLEFRKSLIAHIEEYDANLDSLTLDAKTDEEKELSSLLDQIIAEKKEESKILDAAVSLNSKQTYGLVLINQEDHKVLTDKLSSLIEEYKLGYNQ